MLSQPELKHNNRELGKKTQIHCHNQSSSTTTENLGRKHKYTVTTRARAQQQEKHNPPIGKKHKEYQTKTEKRAQQKQYQTQTHSCNELIDKMNTLSSKHEYLECCVDDGTIETNQLMTRLFYFNSIVYKYSN